MGYDACVLVIFGIPLTFDQYLALSVDLYPKLFTNVGTNLAPLCGSWDCSFGSREEEIKQIVDGWMDPHATIDCTGYVLRNVYHCDQWQGAFLALHVHEHNVTRHADDPKQLAVPTPEAIETFLRFCEPLRLKHQIDAGYVITTVIEGGY